MSQLLLWTLLLPAWGVDFGEADQFFRNRQWQKAAEAYRTKLSAPQPDSDRALFRTVESEALAQRFLVAYRLLRRMGLPKDALWRGRVLLLKAKIEQILASRSGAGGKDEIEGAGFERWTPAQWHRTVRQTYSQLEELQEVLSNLPTGEETTVLEIQDADLSFAPTLWDVAVHAWSRYLLDVAPDPPSALPAWDRFDREMSGELGGNLANGELVGRLYTLASQGNRKSREAARQYWQWKRRFLPLHSPQRVQGSPPDTKDRAQSLQDFAEDLSHPLVRGMAFAGAAQAWNTAGDPKKAVETCQAVEKQTPASFGARECVDLRAEIQLPRLVLTSLPTPPPGTGALEVEVKNLTSLHYRLYAATLETDWRDQTRRPPRAWMEKMLNETPLQSGELRIGPGEPFAVSRVPVPLPPLEAGLYLAVVSSDKHFDPGHSLLEGAILNISDLWLWGEGANTKDKPQFQVFAVSGKTGLPLPQVPISAFVSQSWNQSERVDAKTDKRGRSTFSAPKGGTLEPLAKWNKHHAFWDSPLRYAPAVRSPLRGFVDTDRQVYRRGEKVQFRVTFLQREGAHWLPTPTGAVTVTVKDPRSKVVATVKGSLSQGVWADSFRLPATGVLGEYRFEAQHKKEVATHNLGVEAFEKPRFEITTETSSFIYGTDGRLSLSVATYQGEPIVQGQVRLKVFRKPHVPVFCWWWPPLQGSRVLVHQGQTQTDDGGHAQLDFVVSPDPVHPSRPSQLEIELEVTDATGATQNHQIQRTASAAPWVLAPVSRHQLYAPGSFHVALEFRSLDGTPVSGEAAYTFRKLGRITESVSSNLIDPDLSPLFATQEGERVHSGVLTSDGTKPAEAALPNASPGVYRLEVAAGPYHWSQILFVVDQTPSPTPFLSSWSADAATVGQEITAWIGSQDLKGKILVELWKGDRLIETNWVKGPFHQTKLTVTPEHRGGITLKWRGVYQHQFRQGQAFLDVPWNQSFATTWSAPDRVAPSKKFEALLTSPKAALGWIRIYDARLDGIRPPVAPWLESLYETSPPLPPSLHSSSPNRSTSIPVPLDRQEKQLGILRTFYQNLHPPQFPQLRPEQSYGFRVMVGAKSEMPKGMAETPRQNFADTAFFNGMLKLEEGKTVVPLSVPDSLTRWKVEGGFLATDGSYSGISSAFVSRKPFEVELVAPRPVRVGDEFQIPVVITNGTEDRATAVVSFKDHKSPQQTATLDGGASQVLYWPMRPTLPGPIPVQITGRLGRYQDGERRIVQARPATIPLIRSVAQLDRGPGKSTLKGTPLENITQTHFTVAPQNAAVLAHSLPSVLPVEVPSFNQWVERWVGVSLLSSLIAKHPELTSPSNELMDFPRYSFLVPWIEPEASTIWSLDQARTTTGEARRKWAEFQTDSGGYSWFPGGTPSRFLTLYLLEALVRAHPNHLPPESEWKKPLAWVGPPTKEADSFELYVLSQYAKRATHLRAPILQAVDKLTAKSPLEKFHRLAIFAALGEAKKKQEAEKELLDGIRQNSSGGSWLGEPEGWRFFQDNIALHAQVLSYLLQHSPQSPHIWPLAQWLWNHRRANRWNSRRGTLEAVSALLSLSSDSTHKVEFVWDGKPTQTQESWEATLEGEAAAAQWNSGVELNRAGEGVSYSTLVAVGNQTNPPPSEKGRPLHIERTFLKRSGKRWEPLDGDGVRVGDTIRVELSLTSNVPLEFVSAIVPRAGGMEPRDTQSGWTQGAGPTYREIDEGEDRLHFLSLPQGTARIHFEWTAKTRGKFLVSPARAQSQFAPELTANTADGVLVVE